MPFPPDVEERIRELADRGLRPSAIRAELERDERFAGVDIPSIKSIGRRLNGFKAAEGTAWSMLDREGVPAREPLLRTLAEVIERTEGRRTYLTHAEAECVHQLCEVRPELGGWTAYRLARLLLQEPAPGVRAGVEGYLAFFPTTARGWVRYATCLDRGFLPPGPLFMYGFESDDLWELARHWPAGNTPEWESVVRAVRDGDRPNDAVRNAMSALWIGKPADPARDVLGLAGKLADEELVRGLVVGLGQALASVLEGDE